MATNNHLFSTNLSKVAQMSKPCLQLLSVLDTESQLGPLGTTHWLKSSAKSQIHATRLGDSLHQEAWSDYSTRYLHVKLALYVASSSQSLEQLHILAQFPSFPQPAVEERVLCPSRWQNPSGVCCCSAAAVVLLLFTSLFCPNIHVCSHWLLLFSTSPRPDWISSRFDFQFCACGLREGNYSSLWGANTQSPRGLMTHPNLWEDGSRHLKHRKSCSVNKALGFKMFFYIIDKKMFLLVSCDANWSHVFFGKQHTIVCVFQRNIE